MSNFVIPAAASRPPAGTRFPETGLRPGLPSSDRLSIPRIGTRDQVMPQRAGIVDAWPGRYAEAGASEGEIIMAATDVLRWFVHRSDPPVVQSLVVETEERLVLRNQQQLEQAKQALGGRYVLHPSNKVARQREERPRAPNVRIVRPSRSGS